MSRPYYSSDAKRRKKAPPLSGPPRVETKPNSQGVQQTVSNAKGNTFTTETRPVDPIDGRYAPPLKGGMVGARPGTGPTPVLPPDNRPVDPGFSQPGQPGGIPAKTTAPPIGLDQLGPGGVGANMPPDLSSYPHGRPIFDPQSDEMQQGLDQLNRIGIDAKLTGRRPAQLTQGLHPDQNQEISNLQTPNDMIGTVQNREIPDQPPPGMINNPNQPTMPKGPPLDPAEAEYQSERQRYMDEMKNGPHKQGKGSQILFQIADAMANFGRGMQGQQMEPFRWLGEAKDQRRNVLATQRFAPFEQQHQERLQQREAQSQQDYRASQAQKNMAEAKKAANPNADLEYKTSGNKTFSRPKNAPPGTQWTEETQLQDETKTPIKQVLPDGTPFFTTGDKVADRIAETDAKNAANQLRAGEINQNEYDKYQNNMEQWSTTTRSNQEKRDSLNTQADTEEQNADAFAETAGQRKQRANETDDDTEKRKLLQEADEYAIKSREARVKARGYRKQVSGIKDPARPQAPGKVSAPTVQNPTSAPKRVTKDQLEMIKQQNPTMTEKQLRDMAKREGYEVD